MSWSAVQAVAEVIVAIVALVAFIIRYSELLASPKSKLIYRLIFLLVLSVSPLFFLVTAFFGLKHGWHPAKGEAYLLCSLLLITISFCVPAQSGTSPTRIDIALLVFMSAIITILAASELAVFTIWEAEHKDQATPTSTATAGPLLP